MVTGRRPGPRRAPGPPPYPGSRPYHRPRSRLNSLIESTSPAGRTEASQAVFRSLRQRAHSAAKAHLGPILAARQPRRVDLSPQLWGLQVGPNGALWSGGVDLQALADRIGTPFHVVRADALDRNAADALAHREHGGPDAFYSYKTNPVPDVLRRLHARGVGAEVISPYELWLALELGVDPARIIYNGPAKSPASLEAAIDAGILLINANSPSEAARIADIARRRRRTVNLGLRFSMPHMWGGQFGIDAGSEAAVDVVRAAVEDASVVLRGVHVHRGLTIRDRDTLTGFVTGVLALCDRLRSGTGWHPEVLDIGGSVACPTVRSLAPKEYRMNRALGTDLLAPDPAATLGLGEAAAVAHGLVVEHFARAGLPAPLVIQEPGRAMTGNTQFLVTSVVDVKTDGGLHHAVLDAGMNTAEPVRNEFHQLFSVTAPAAPHDRPYRLVGPICTPADVLYNHWRLPELVPGDVVAIMDSGAYFVPFSTSFSFPRPGIVMQEGEVITTCRRAETFDDLIALDRDETRRAVA